MMLRRLVHIANSNKNVVTCNSNNNKSSLYNHFKSSNINETITTTTQQYANVNVRYYSHNKAINNNLSNNISDQEIESQVFQFKPTLNFQYIRDNAEYLQKNAIDRKSDVDVHNVVDMYERYRVVKRDIDSVRKQRNETSTKMKDKKLTREERDQLVEQGKSIKTRLADMEKTHDDLLSSMTSEALRIPNATHPEVPVGAEDESAVLLGHHGHIRQFDFPIRDHLEIAKMIGALESANHTAGNRFYYMTGPGALLEMALSFWAFQRVHYKLGFEPVITPDVIHPSLAEACGFQPRSAASQLYWFRDHDLCLTATAEIPLAGMYAHQTLPTSKLPIKQVGFSHCFRSEVGGGTNNRGIYRVHQFSKVEMFVLANEQDSDRIHRELLDTQIEMFNELELPFRVLDMPTGDLGAPAYRKFDIEVWIPSRNGYGEISSTSNCTDYQSRRLNIKHHLHADADSHFVHTLNGTAIAIPRIILAILENNQQKDGSVLIPKILRPFLNNQEYFYPSNKST